MDDNEKLQRVLDVFAERGWASKDDILSDHDKDADWEAVRDIGPVFAPMMKRLMALEGQEWRDATGLLYHTGEVVEGSIEG